MLFVYMDLLQERMVNIMDHCLRNVALYYANNANLEYRMYYLRGC